MKIKILYERYKNYSHHRHYYITEPGADPNIIYIEFSSKKYPEPVTIQLDRKDYQEIRKKEFHFSKTQKNSFRFDIILTKMVDHESFDTKLSKFILEQMGYDVSNNTTHHVVFKDGNYGNFCRNNLDWLPRTGTIRKAGGEVRYTTLHKENMMPTIRYEDIITPAGTLIHYMVIRFSYNHEKFAKRLVFKEENHDKIKEKMIRWYQDCMEKLHRGKFLDRKHIIEERKFGVRICQPSDGSSPRLYGFTSYNKVAFRKSVSFKTKEERDLAEQTILDYVKSLEQLLQIKIHVDFKYKQDDI